MLTPLGKVTQTKRYFEFIAFDDRYDTPCSLQQSSIFSDEYIDKPGATAVWLGVDRQISQHDGMFDAANQTRMHLDRKQVQALIAVLETWLKCGSFAEDKPKQPPPLATGIHRRNPSTNQPKDS
jgi:hypothetical protein